MGTWAVTPHRFLEVANWAVYARHMDVAMAASAHLLAAAQQAVCHSAAPRERRQRIEAYEAGVAQPGAGRGDHF